MRLNQNLTLSCRGDCKVLLVPYREEHVLRYHDWMQDPDLLEATASEPLTLEEEYEMQRSWCEDDTKCTFIILDRDFPDTQGTGIHGGGMAGDVNLYWNDHEEPNTAEIEIMIAEHKSRRKGIARQSLTMFMAWAATELEVTKFRAKIGCKNLASQTLFRLLGFVHVRTSEVFQEETFELSADGETSLEWKKLLSWREKLLQGSYDHEKAEAN